MNKVKTYIQEVVFNLTEEELTEAVIDWVNDNGEFASSDISNIKISADGDVSLVVRYITEDAEANE